MLLQFPSEIVSSIAACCPRGAQASLALTCRSLYSICNRILYRADVARGNPRSVFYPISRYKDEQLIISTLEMSISSGADLQKAWKYNGLGFFVCAEGHCPIYLAAVRGLEDVVSFLVRQGVSPDGPSAALSELSPFSGALLAGQEQTALQLLKSGATIQEMRGLTCLHIAVQKGMLRLTEYLILERNMEIDRRSGSGASAIMIALQTGSQPQLEQLARLGANLYEPLIHACHAHNYAGATRLLDTAGSHVTSQLQLQQVADLVILVTTHSKLRSRVPLVEKLLALGKAKATSSEEEQPDISSTDFQAILNGLLQHVLSLEQGTDVDIAILLMRYGAQIHASTLVQVMVTLRQFCRNKFNTLEKHPKLLQVFRVVYVNLVAATQENRSALARYFLRRVPEDAVIIVEELVSRNLNLDIYGMKMLLESGNAA